jgi:outer membrane protein, heavy metal efflux system
MKIIVTIVFISVMAATAVFAQSPDEYFIIAADNNPGLKASYKEFEASMEKIPQVNTLPDPSFSFGYFISPVETRLGPQRARFSLSQMFPWFGTLKARGDAAALQADARYQAFLEARNNLQFQVASAWYPLYEINRLRQIEKENIKILESYKNIATRNFENGNSPMVDVLRVDIMLKEAQTRLAILNDRKQSFLSLFNILLNRDEGTPVTIPDSLKIEIIEYTMNKDTLLSRNPRLNELELRSQVSGINRELARKQGLPNLGVGVDYVIIGMPEGMLAAENGRDALMPMVSISLPIFRKKYKAAQEEALLMQESYTLQKENTLNLLSSEFERTLFTIKQQQELLALYNQQILTTNQSLNLLFQSYSNSGNDFDEVLRMQQQLLQYEREKASAQKELLTAHAKINYLTAQNDH